MELWGRNRESRSRSLTTQKCALALLILLTPSRSLLLCTNSLARVYLNELTHSHCVDDVWERLENTRETRWHRTSMRECNNEATSSWSVESTLYRRQAPAPAANTVPPKASTASVLTTTVTTVLKKQAEAEVHRRAIMQFLIF